MTKKNNTFKLWKAVLEIRYPATAKLFDRRGEIASTWQFKDDLSEWIISHNQVVIHNKPRTTTLLASHDSLSVVQELPRNAQDFITTASDFATSVISTLTPKKANRLGLRMYYVLERKHFKGLVRKVGDRLYRLSEDEWEVFGGFPEDVGLYLTIRKDDYMANYRFGPMEKEQYKRDNIFTSDDVLGKLPATSLFIDYDLFWPDPTGRPVDSLIATFCEEGPGIIENHVKKFQDRFGEL